MSSDIEMMKEMMAVMKTNNTLTTQVMNLTIANKDYEIQVERLTTELAHLRSQLQASQRAVSHPVTALVALPPPLPSPEVLAENQRLKDKLAASEAQVSTLKADMASIVSSNDEAMSRLSKEKGAAIEQATRLSAAKESLVHDNASLTAEVSRLTTALQGARSSPTPASVIEENTALKTRCESLATELEKEVVKAGKLRKSVEEKLALEEKVAGLEAAKEDLEKEAAAKTDKLGKSVEEKLALEEKVVGLEAAKEGLEQEAAAKADKLRKSVEEKLAIEEKMVGLEAVKEELEAWKTSPCWAEFAAAEAARAARAAEAARLSTLTELRAKVTGYPHPINAFALDIIAAHKSRSIQYISERSPGSAMWNACSHLVSSSMEFTDSQPKRWGTAVSKEYADFLIKLFGKYRGKLDGYDVYDLMSTKRPSIEDFTRWWESVPTHCGKRLRRPFSHAAIHPFIREWCRPPNTK